MKYVIVFLAWVFTVWLLWSFVVWDFTYMFQSSGDRFMFVVLSLPGLALLPPLRD